MLKEVFQVKQPENERDQITQMDPVQAAHFVFEQRVAPLGAAEYMSGLSEYFSNDTKFSYHVASRFFVEVYEVKWLEANEDENFERLQQVLREKYKFELKQSNEASSHILFLKEFGKLIIERCGQSMDRKDAA